MKTLRPLKAIRADCLDCCGTFKAVKFCTCDGINSRRCELWPYRFGMRPDSAAKRFGKAFVTPGELPDHQTPLEECGTPGEPTQANP